METNTATATLPTITLNGSVYLLHDIIAADRDAIETTYPNMATTFPSLCRILCVSKPKGRKYYTADVYKDGRVNVY